MNTLVSTMKKWSVLLLFAGALSLPANAQSSQDRLMDMMRRMEEQMRRSMGLDSTFTGEQFQMSPDSNSFFYFHVDTSFNGMGGSDFFQGSPFGGPGMSGFPEFDRLLDQFFNGGDTPVQPPAYGDLPPDDGAQPEEEGDLLPEERLRRQESQGGQHAPANPDEPKPAKPKVKTIRI